MRLTNVLLIMIALVFVLAGTAGAGVKTWDYGSGTTDGVDQIVGHQPAVHNDGYADNMYLHRGADVASGRDEGDLIRGHKGDDKLYGNGGNDRLWGGDGNDYLSGGDDNDGIFATGDAQADNINCGPGWDFVDAEYVYRPGDFDSVESNCEDVLWFRVGPPTRWAERVG